MITLEDRGLFMDGKLIIPGVVDPDASMKIDSRSATVKTVDRCKIVTVDLIVSDDLLLG